MTRTRVDAAAKACIDAARVVAKNAGGGSLKTKKGKAPNDVGYGCTN